MTVIIDTNVLLIANGQHEGVEQECIDTCIFRLQEIMKSKRVVLDSNREILSEYLNKTNPWNGKRAGDLFLKWLIQNQSNDRHCDLVNIFSCVSNGYENFPADARLSAFDRSDRKFVAVAAAHAERPPILQAADSKWALWEPALREHGICVEFLCREDIQRFSDNKAAKKGKR